MILVYIELLAGVDLERFMVAGKLTQEKCKDLNTLQAFSQTQSGTFKNIFCFKT